MAYVFKLKSILVKYILVLYHAFLICRREFHLDRTVIVVSVNGKLLHVSSVEFLRINKPIECVIQLHTDMCRATNKYTHICVYYSGRL